MSPRRDESDRRRVDRLSEAAAGGGAGDATDLETPERVVDKQVADSIRRSSPWYQGDPSEPGLAGWTEPSYPGPESSERDRLRYIARHNSFLDDLERIYGDGWVQRREVAKLRAARSSVDMSELTEEDLLSEVDNPAAPIPDPDSSIDPHETEDSGP